MAWTNVGRIKGDTGSTGGSAYITLDSAHGIIYLGDDDHEYAITLASLKGAKGDTGATGATGPAGPVNLVSTLDTADSTNAVTNGAIATAIQNVTNQIGTITSAQTANLTLLGS